MFSKDKPKGQDTLDTDPKFYHGLWTLSLVLADIAKEGGDNGDGHRMSRPSTSAQESMSHGQDKT